MGIKASASVTVAQVTDGTDGNGIKSTVVEYQAGASGTTAPTGSWSTSIPATTASAPYLWTKVTYTYTDGSAPKVVYSVGSTPEGIVVGGRNLAQRTSSSFTNAFTNFTGGQNICPSLAKVLTDGLSVGDIITVKLIYKYTDIVATSGQTAICYVQGAGDVTGWSAGKFELSPRKTLSGSGEHEFLYSFKITADHLKNSFWDTNIRHDYVQSGSVQWKMYKVERGNKATDWTPAPEDVNASIAAVNKKVNNAQLEIDAANGKITTLTSETSSLGTRMTTVEQTASDLTVRINTTDSNVATAQSTADTAKKNAATAQSTANTAKSTADTAKSTADTAKANAATAQSTANTAKANAATAQSTADTAKANAATAQSTANTARNEAANAAKTATNYLNFSSKGLIVGDVTAETLGNNVLIDSDSVDIRSGNTVLASFGSQYIYIGKESSQATVDFCNGLGTIGYKAGEISNERLYIYSNKEIEIHTEYYAVIDSSYSVTNSDGTLQELCNANININAGHGANDFHPRSIASVVERHDYINNKHYITELKMYENLISLSTDVDLGNDNDDCSELKIYYDEIWLNTGHVKLNTMIGAGETTEILGNTTFYDGIEISHNTPYIDFHFGGSTADYTSRIIENSSGTLSINGVECSDGSLTATHVTSTAEAYFNGPVYFANGQWNHLGDDVLFGDQNFAGGFCIYGVTGAPQIVFVNNGAGIASLNSQSLRFAPGGEEHGWALLGVADNMWGFYPNYNSHSLNLGTSGHKWVNVYARNGTIQTSDEREKDILGVIDERYFAFFERIDPIKYRWRDDEKDTRVRLGIGAQTAEKALIESGLSLEEYAGISHYYFDEPLSNGLYDSYSMDYTMYTIIAAAQTKKNMYSIREIEKYQEEQKQSVKSSQQQIDQLREELSQTRTDYVELLMEVKRLKEKLESVA